MKRTKVRESKTAPVPGPAVTPHRITVGPAILEVQERQLTLAERKELLEQELQKIKKALRLARCEQEEKYTLDEAFSYEQKASVLDIQKAIRSIAFLLDWGSEGGNEPLDATLALGLVQAANKCAEDAGHFFDSDDVWRLGGDPRKAKQED